MTFNRQFLTDIKMLHIDTSLDKDSRLLQYAVAVNDPYHFRVGDTAVNVCYGGGGTLQESITKILSGKYSSKTDGFVV